MRACAAVGAAAAWCWCLARLLLAALPALARAPLRRTSHLTCLLLSAAHFCRALPPRPCLRTCSHAPSRLFTGLCTSRLLFSLSLVADEFVSAVVRVSAALYASHEAALHADAARASLEADGGLPRPPHAASEGQRSPPKGSPPFPAARSSHGRPGGQTAAAAAQGTTDDRRTAASFAAAAKADRAGGPSEAESSDKGAEAEELSAQQAIATDGGGVATKLDMLMRQRVIPRALLAIGSEQEVDTVLRGRMALAMLRTHENALGSLFDQYAALHDAPSSERLDRLSVREWMALLEDGRLFDDAVQAQPTSSQKSALPPTGAKQHAPPQLWLPVRVALRTFAHACLDSDLWGQEETVAGLLVETAIAGTWPPDGAPSGSADSTRAHSQATTGRASGGAAAMNSTTMHAFVEMDFHQFAVAVCRLSYEKLIYLEESGVLERTHDEQARRMGLLPRSAPTEHAFITRVDEFLTEFLARFAPLLRKPVPKGHGMPRHATLAITRSPSDKRGESWRSNFLAHTRPETGGRTASMRPAQRIELFSIVKPKKRASATRFAEAFAAQSAS